MLHSKFHRTASCTQYTTCTQYTQYTLGLVLFLFSILVYSVPLPLKADSLWQGNDTERTSSGSEDSLYSKSKPREFKVHDLITILIKENISGNFQGTNKSDQRTRWEWLLSKFPRLKSKNGSYVLKEDNVKTAPQIGWDGRLRNDNQGQLQESSIFTTTVQAEVASVLPNGNLVLEAKKRIKFNDEDETILATGTVSSKDVGTDNSVSSEKIANFNVTLDSKGVVGDTQKKGWFTKILNTIWPF